MAIPTTPPDVIDDLLKVDYVDQRRELTGESASWEVRPGAPGGRAPRLPTPAEPPAAELIGSLVGFPDPLGRPIGDTCHLDVVDRCGNMVAATPSGGWL